jgi:hypothetical protein
MNKSDVPFAPDDADSDLIVSVIRIGSEQEHSEYHTDNDGLNHDVCCWAVATALETRRHRRVDLLREDMEDMTSWLIPSDFALTIAVFDNASPFGLLVRSRSVPQAPQFVWFRDKLYQRNRHSGQLTFIQDAPIRWTRDELGLTGGAS